jgi:hypothetical protein
MIITATSEQSVVRNNFVTIPQIQSLKRSNLQDPPIHGHSQHNTTPEKANRYSRAIWPSEAYPRTLNFPHRIRAPHQHRNQPQPSTQPSAPRLAGAPARVRMSPYLVEALAPGGGWSGGGGGGSPLVVAAIGVGVAGNPSPSALATHSTGGGGGSEVAVAWNGGFGNWKMGVSDWDFIQWRAARGCAENFPALSSGSAGVEPRQAPRTCNLFGWWVGDGRC